MNEEPQVVARPPQKLCNDCWRGDGYLPFREPKALVSGTCERCGKSPRLIMEPTAEHVRHD